MANEKKVVDPALFGFYKAMERSNTEKIAHETLAGMSKDSTDSGSLMQGVGVKMPIIGPGDQPSNRAN
jgi:hypothetical protein